MNGSQHEKNRAISHVESKKKKPKFNTPMKNTFPNNNYNIIMGSTYENTTYLFIFS